MLYCLFVFLLCVLIGVVLYIWIKSLEYLWCIFVLHQIPFVASAAHEPMPATPVALAITDGQADEPQSIGEILAQKPL